MSHPPQFVGSVCVSRHPNTTAVPVPRRVAHAVLPPEQVGAPTGVLQVPASQTWPARQGFPHPPHAFGDALGSRQIGVPPMVHELSPGLHAQVPVPLQYSRSPQTAAAAHDPQLVGSSAVSVQSPGRPPPAPHTVELPGQEHELAAHDANVAHVFPHAPQFFGSVAVLVQTPPQVVAPEPQMQTPETQVAPEPHFVPHPPQLFTSVDSSMHAPPQMTCPVGQRQALPLHVDPVAQTLPQVPQFFGSVVVSAQLPEHSVSPVGQMHLPPAHVAPAPHLVPHVPQLFGSVVRLTHVPGAAPQTSGVAAGHAEQTPLTHDLPDAHFVKQPPHAATSLERSLQAVPQFT